MPDLLLELLSEEIPARMQARAADDLKRLVTGKLAEAGLPHDGAGAFATPRRLVLTVTGLPSATPARREERKGPRADAPEAAVEGFLRSTGLARDRLETRDGGKGPVLFAVVERPGRPADEAVAEAVTETVRTFPWPKSMRWGAGALRWVRPLHSILCILSDETGARVAPIDIDGIAAGNTTRGHHFMAPEPFAVTGFDDYAAKLADAKVMLDPAARRAKIAHDAAQLAFAQGLETVEDKGLLAEVAGLVEWPVVLMGDIDPEFLDLPPEVLQAAMREHQKFFSVRNPKTGRIERFITVANIETADRGATILAGNRKVLAARLADAKFFWENDLRTIESGGMEALAAPLKHAVFHARLGTQADRIARIAALAREIAPQIDADPGTAVLAARIAKADLASEMVREFPKLQGVMGGYYARVADPNIPDAAADACAAHYRPLGPSDAVPDDPIAIAVALADKIDALTGFWTIGEKPTGAKDPFALRRAALGVIRILLEANLRLPLGPLFEAGIGRHAGTGDTETIIKNLQAFITNRLVFHLRDQGFRHDVIDACSGADGRDDPVRLTASVRAVQAFLGTGDGADLLAGYRRAANILAAADRHPSDAAMSHSDYDVDPDLLRDADEKALFAALDAAKPAVEKALQAEDFTAAMDRMAGLRVPIDAFFEHVTVNADDPALRENRLRLLARVAQGMRLVADWDAVEG